MSDTEESHKRSPQLAKLNVTDLEVIAGALEKLSDLGFTSIQDCAKLADSAKQLRDEKAPAGKTVELTKPNEARKGLLPLYEARQPKMDGGEGLNLLFQSSAAA